MKIDSFFLLLSFVLLIKTNSFEKKTSFIIFTSIALFLFQKKKAIYIRENNL